MAIQWNLSFLFTVYDVSKQVLFGGLRICISKLKLKKTITLDILFYISCETSEYKKEECS